MMKSKSRRVRKPEPDFIERTVVTVTPTTYASRSFMEPTEVYKKRIAKLKKNRVTTDD